MDVFNVCLQVPVHGELLPTLLTFVPHRKMFLCHMTVKLFLSVEAFTTLKLHTVKRLPMDFLLHVYFFKVSCEIVSSRECLVTLATLDV